MPPGAKVAKLHQRLRGKGYKLGKRAAPAKHKQPLAPGKPPQDRKAGLINRS